MPHLGGVEIFTQSIAAELSKDSQVTVFCMNSEDQPAVAREGEVTVYFLPCLPLQKGRFPIPKPSALQIIKYQLQQEKPDFAIIQCRFYLLCYYACLILHHFRIPFIQIEHGAGDVGMKNPIVNVIWHCYDRILTFFEKRIPHDFYAVSQAGLRWLERYGIHGAGVITNGIVPDDFSKALSDPGEWRKSQNIPDDAIIITYSGRIMREKGIVDLLEAFTNLSAPNLYLVIAGDGEMDLVQQWRGKENIRFLGQIPFSEIPYLLSDTQIYCLPSHFIEGQGRGILEAGYCGAAVTATANGGIPEIIISDQYGILYPSGDVEALTKAIQYLIDHPDERIRIGKNLQKRISEHFTCQVAAEAIYAAMKKCGL